MFDWIKQKIYNTGLYIRYDRYKTNKLRKEIYQDGKKSASDFSWENYKSSDTLYILGSGLSVLDLSESDWKEIKKHDTFGFNTWIFHGFVPTFFGVEPMGNDGVFERYIKILTDKKDEYENTPIFIQYQHLKMRGRSFDQEGIHKKNLWYNAPYMPNTTNPKVLRDMMSNWINTNHSDFSEVFHYAGSLSYAVNMGYIMGYKKIVLLGVDLNSSEYYYSGENVSDMAKEFNTYQEARIEAENWNLKATHNTMSKKISGNFGCLPISYFIENFKDLASEKGVEILIGNKGSALYPMLELYEFPKN